VLLLQIIAQPRKADPGLWPAGSGSTDTKASASQAEILLTCKTSGAFSWARLPQVGLGVNTAFIWGQPPVRTDKKNVRENPKREMKKRQKV